MTPKSFACCPGIGLETRLLKPRQQVVKAGCNSVLIGHYNAADAFHLESCGIHLRSPLKRRNSTLQQVFMSQKTRM